MCSPLCINKNFLAKSSLFPLFSILFFSLLMLHQILLYPCHSFFNPAYSLSQCFYIFYSEFFCKDSFFFALPFIYFFSNNDNVYLWYARKKVPVVVIILKNSSALFIIFFLRFFIFG